MSVLNPCPRNGCGGSLTRDVYEHPCSVCKDNGASVCQNCWLEIEWTCTLCARQVLEPWKKRGRIEQR